MIDKKIVKIQKQKNVCIGTGLVALDAVINGEPEKSPKLWAGGSCGNVLTILSYLGWQSFPIARLSDDFAAMELLKDMRRWNVNTSLISRNESGSTPIIVEKIGTNRSGIPWHRFEWICPNCGSWLPRYKPVLAKDVDSIRMTMPKSQVFYFDRVSRSSVELAKINKSHGALIVFEPSSMKDEKLFYECIQTTDILKYSHERLGHVHNMTKNIYVSMEIETLGEEGLRYRYGNNSRWKNIRAYPVENLKDAAGSGDWCTAGIIYLLGYNGKEGFDSFQENDIDDALKFGQALAALNCYYEGARGCMYSITKQEFGLRINDILNGTSLLALDSKESNETIEVLKCICPNCVGKKN